MAHFAQLDDDDTVIQVIVADNKEWCEGVLGGRWVQTSYNTHGGVHTNGGIPLHKNYAGIGYKFDGVGFFAPQPYPSWVLDQFTYLWEAPVAMPDDGKFYTWNEADQKWDEVPSDLE
jgi:hypothetical protein